MNKIALYLFVFFLITSCNSSNDKVIVIQPFGDFSKADSKQVLEEIKKINPTAVLRNNIPFPDEAYYKPRNRYKADLLLSYLGKRIGRDSVIIGLSWKANKADQFYKVALHELGHTEGLQHCPIKSCLMRDAEGGNPLDDETAFCTACKKYLQTKNWKFL
jgi:archaemetzincin